MFCCSAAISTQLLNYLCREGSTLEFFSRYFLAAQLEDSELLSWKIPLKFPILLKMKNVVY